MPPNFYNLLGVHPSYDLDSKQLRTNYLSLSLQHHPDKINSQMMMPDEISQSNQLYIAIRHAYETLKKTSLRGAYDKLGPAALNCQHCKTERDFFLEAARSWISFYSITAGILVVLSIIGRLDFGRYWRFAGLLAIAAIEAKMIFASKDILPYVLPWRTTFEKISILRQLFVTISIAISQTGPILFSTDDRSNLQLINELEQLLDMHAWQSISDFEDVFAPFRDDPKAAGHLQRKMEILALQHAAIRAAAINAGTSSRPPSEPES
eukprot:jgi/Hompol1/5235/HPOL_004265-RA